MYDTYYHRCEFCAKQISMHIGDWCIPRDKVHVICDWCSRKKDNKETIRYFKRMPFFTTELVRQPWTVKENGANIGQPEKGRIVMIACEIKPRKTVGLNQ